MADIDILRAELTNDPEGIGYADLSDPVVAKRLNSPSRTIMGTVPASDVRRFVLLKGLWPRISAAAQSSADSNVQGTAVTILQTLAPNSFDEFRMGDPEVFSAVSQMLGTLVAADVMTADQKDAMVALGNRSVSRAEELGLPMIHHLDVAEARNG